MPDSTLPPPPQPRRLEYMRITDVVPAERNPKGHDVAGIRRSATDLGWIETPILDERTGRLLAGHGRLEALTELHADGAAPPEGILVDDDGTWLVPVTRGYASRDDAAAEAAIIGLNRWVERGGWDTDMLAAMAIDLPDPLLEVIGYNSDDLDAIIEAAGLAPVPTFVPVEPDAQPRLDVRNPIVCPACGHHFHRS